MLSDSDLSDRDVAQVAPDADKIGSKLPELPDCPDLLHVATTIPEAELTAS